MPAATETPTKALPYAPGVLAGVEYSTTPNAQLSEEEKRELKSIVNAGTKRDTPARLLEIIQAWEPLDVSTPIATPCGWKTMGSLLPGDYVFGSNGRIANVTHAHPIQEQNSYSLFFSDGSSIIAGEKHSWMTTTCKERSVEKQDKERTTKELFETQDRQHAIRMMPGLQTFDTHLLIDPYMLGCRMGLLGNKRIPEIYLRASFEQRLALLQGLMDTDGWATSNGGCGWGQFKEHRAVIDGFSELLTSLGIKHQFYAYQRKREDGEPFEFWQTTFYSDLPCFRLKRKADRQTKRKGNRSRLIYITGIEEVGMRSVRCITVDTPDHLFLAGKSMVPTHNCALFYRGFQFLIPQRGGGWSIPGESTGYGPAMQMDLALLPTNIYSANGQILISTLTRAIPSVRFEPQDAGNDAAITCAESAEKFIRVIERNNDLIMTQTDAARYLYTDGRAMYYTRFMKDGQRFGWEEEDAADNVVPENIPVEGQAGGDGENGQAPQPDEEAAETPAETQGEGQTGEEPVESGEEPAVPAKERIPRGQEVRTCHGKLEVKIIPMTANELSEADMVQYETEVGVSRAKGMFPDVADDIKGGGTGQSEGEIARLARINVKLGMQSTYITSDSVADDVTIQRNWFRVSALTKITNETVRESLIAKFPDGGVVVYAGETFCYARNESMDDCWALMQAFSGDGQNRNALGTSMMPIQKRVNNWLDLLNDSFVRTIPKKWMHNKAFDVETLKGQTNVPGDIGAYKPQAGMTADQLVFVEPAVMVSPVLSEFVKEYIGPISQLLSGAYPALSGGDTGMNDTASGIQTQRDQALGRIGPTWHSIQNAEAAAMRQAVRWAAKCRDKSINERIPGGETIRLEVNNLKANILCFAESDENFPETHTAKQNRLMGVFQDSAKNPQLQEVLYNASNLEFFVSMAALTELYIPPVAYRNKQLGEFEILLKSGPNPNPAVFEGQKKIEMLTSQGVDPALLQQAQQQLAAMPPEVSTVEVDDKVDDSFTEAETCLQWLNSPEGRKEKRQNPNGYRNLRLHYLEHQAISAAKSAANAPSTTKPPSQSINLKDLGPGERAQMLSEVNIKSDPMPPPIPPMAPVTQPAGGAP
jgi:hypothetical protein